MSQYLLYEFNERRSLSTRNIICPDCSGHCRSGLPAKYHGSINWCERHILNGKSMERFYKSSRCRMDESEVELVAGCARCGIEGSRVEALVCLRIQG